MGLVEGAEKLAARAAGGVRRLHAIAKRAPKCLRGKFKSWAEGGWQVGQGWISWGAC